jgi:phospholipid/cholesterol/gamma-HCH transport system substrate-binding protein
MENRAYALLTGLFVIGLGVAAALASLWLNDSRQARTPYLIVTQGAISGLVPYSTVRYRGVEIGQVTSVEFAQDGSRDINIRIEIKPEIPITANTYATLRYMGITGLAQIELADDGPPGAERVQTSPEQLARISMRPSLFESLGDAGQAMLEQFKGLVGQLREALGPENQANLRQIMANVEITSRKTAEFTERLEPLINALPKMGEDGGKTMARVEQIAKELEQTVTQVRQVTAQLNTLGTLAESAGQTFLVETLPSTQSTLREIESAARNLDRLSDELRRDPSSILYGRNRDGDQAQPATKGNRLP